MKKKHKIKIGKIKYNKSNPEKLSIEQAHQYIDDTLNLDQVKKDADDLKVEDGFTNTSPENRAKAINYWLNMCVKHNYISDIENEFLKLLFMGTPKGVLFQLMKPYFPKINKLQDIDICKKNIIAKVEDGMNNIQSKCIPIFADPYINQSIVGV